MGATYEYANARAICERRENAGDYMSAVEVNKMNRVVNAEKRVRDVHVREHSKPAYHYIDRDI